MRNFAHLALGMAVFGPVFAPSNDAGIRSAVQAAEKVDGDADVGLSPTSATGEADLTAAVTAFEALSEEDRGKAIAALRNEEHDAAADALSDPIIRDSIKAMGAVKDPDGEDYNDLFGFLDGLDLDDDE